MSWHRLPILRTVTETQRDKSLVLGMPEALRDTFRWRAGQHVVVRRILDGEEHRRCYSISSAPGDSLRITVRRLDPGRVSGDLHDRAEVGSTVEVSAPCGTFCLDTAPTAYRTHYAFAAGSGITPIRSMLGAVLEHEPHSTVNLLYGSRTLDSILFRDELDALHAAHPERFRRTLLLTSPPWFSSFDGWRGRIDADAVQRFVDQHPPVAQDAQYWICGPGTMNATVRDALMAIDVPTQRIHAESFGSPSATKAAAVDGVAATLEVLLDGRQSTVSVEAGETLLAAMRRAGLSPPSACTAGICSTCRCRVESGSVEHRARMALDDDELARGWVLPCQAVAASGRLGLRYE